MALVSTDWQVQVGKAIRYVGADHAAAGAGYVTVLELHRWLQSLADDASVANDDYLESRQSIRPTRSLTPLSR